MSSFICSAHFSQGKINGPDIFPWTTQQQPIGESTVSSTAMSSVPAPDPPPLALCANCLSSDTVSKKSRLKNSPSTSLRSALFQIYGVSFPFPESADDNNLVLCRNCDNFLFQLHHTFNHFKDLSRPTSWIGAAHQDLSNSKGIKIEVVENDGAVLPPPYTTAYMVQDAGCQYEDQDSEDDLDLYDGSPLRALASQYKVPMDIKIESVKSGVQLKADEVYGSDEDSRNVVLQNWTVPSSIFEDDKTEEPAEDPLALANPLRQKRRVGRPRGRGRGGTGSTSKIRFNFVDPNDRDAGVGRVVELADWSPRMSGRIKTPTLKIENAYSLSTTATTPLSLNGTSDLPVKRGPGRPPRPKPVLITPKMEPPSSPPVALHATSIKVVPTSFSTVTSAVATVYNGIAPTIRGGIVKRGTYRGRGRGRGRGARPQSLGRALIETALISSASKRKAESDPDWNLTPVPVEVKVRTRLSNGHDPKAKVSVLPMPVVQNHRNRQEGQDSNAKSPPKVIPLTRGREVKVKIGPGKPGPGGSLSTPPPLSKPTYKYKCTDCGEKFLSINEILMHKKVSHGVQVKPDQPQPRTPEPARCSTCNKQFFSKVAMLTHYEVMHGGGGAPEGLKKFSCRKAGCGKTFLYDASRKAHEATHFGPAHTAPVSATVGVLTAPKEQCTMCDKKFYTHDYLKLHLRDHHRTPGTGVQPGFSGSSETEMELNSVQV